MSPWALTMVRTYFCHALFLNYTIDRGNKFVQPQK